MLESRINDLYWTFTRCKRGKPPCVVAPELYARRAEVIGRLRTLAVARRLRHPTSPVVAMVAPEILP